MWNEVLSSVGAQDMDTSGFQVSDLDDAEFYWKNDQLELGAVFGPGINTRTSPTAFGDLEMWISGENPILLEHEEDRETLLPQRESLRDKHERLDCREVVY